jgi:hypothetical protein
MLNFVVSTMCVLQETDGRQLRQMAADKAMPRSFAPKSGCCAQLRMLAHQLLLPVYWLWQRRHLSWPKTKTILQALAVTVLCAVVVWVLLDKFQLQDPDGDFSSLPALCVQNVKLTEFATSMNWTKYRQPNYIIQEEERLAPPWRGTTPVPVVCMDSRNFCNDSNWVPWPGDVFNLWFYFWQTTSTSQWDRGYTTYAGS